MESFFEDVLEMEGEFNSLKQESEFIGIPTAAKLGNTTPTCILKAMRSGEMPVDMVFYQKTRIEKWVHSAGKDFFKKHQ